MRFMLSAIIDFISSLVICSIFEPYVLLLVPFLIYIGYIWAKLILNVQENFIELKVFYIKFN